MATTIPSRSLVFDAGHPVPTTLAASRPQYLPGDRDDYGCWRSDDLRDGVEPTDSRDLREADPDGRLGLLHRRAMYAPPASVQRWRVPEARLGNEDLCVQPALDGALGATTQAGNCQSVTTAPEKAAASRSRHTLPQGGEA